jgi:type I restriction enzyme S subunit
MTTEQFFEKFELFAGAPNAILRLRQLILELAVRGQLTAPTQPSATNHPSAPSDSSAEPFPIPEDWRWVKLSEAADTRAASKVSPSTISDASWVLDLEDIDGASGKIVARATFAERCSQSTKAAFVPGDVLYGKLRPYLNKVVVAEQPGFCTTEIIPLRPKTGVSAHFLRLWLRSPSFLRFAEEKSYGMKMPRLGTKDLESSAVPLSPLAEQKRIVAKVDALMALCDQLEAQQQERKTKHAALSGASLARFAEAPTPSNLNFLFHHSNDISPADLRKTILTLAVQGKLVPQDPNDIPPQPSLSSKKLDGDQVMPNPPTWTWTQVDQTGEVSLGRQRAPQHHQGPYMRPYLRVQNVYEARIDVSDVKEMNFTPEEFKTFALKSGDILLNEGQSRELVGRPAIYRDEVPGACFQNTLVRYRAYKCVIPEYALIVFRAYMRNGRFQEISKQTTNIAHLSAGRFAQLEFPLPPLAEQKRIVAKVDELMALVDQLEEQLASSRTLGAQLTEAVVAELTTAA